MNSTSKHLKFLHRCLLVATATATATAAAAGGKDQQEYN
jgi:hypothetical protein